MPPTVKEIFIKNDRELNNLNIESLYNPDKGLYVFDYLNINYIERPTSIFQSGRIEKIESALLFGNPLFSIIENEIEQKEISKVRSGISPLPFTEKEISNLNTILSKNGIKTVSTNLESSSEDMLYKHSKSNLIHIATHGFYIRRRKK